MPQALDGCICNRRMAECSLQATEFRHGVVRNLAQQVAVEAPGDTQALAAILSGKVGHRGLCRLLQKPQRTRTSAPQAREHLGGGATVAAREIVANCKHIPRVGQLPLLKQRLVGSDHRIQRRPFRKLFHEVVQIMTHFALGMFSDLKQTPAEILADPGIRTALERAGLPLPRERAQDRMYPLLQRGQVGVPALVLGEEQLNPSVEGGGFHAWTVRGRPRKAVRCQIQVHVAVGDGPSLSEAPANGAQLQLDVAAPLLLPVFHQRRVGVGPLRDPLVAGRAGALKKGPLLDVFRAAAQAHLVEKIPQGHGQQLRQPGRGGQIQAAGVGLPGETHQPVAELMGRPLGTVGGMEARHHPIQAEVPEFHFRQLPIAPGGRSFQVRAPLWLPVCRQFQAMEVLKMGEEQT